MKDRYLFKAKSVNDGHWVTGYHFKDFDNKHWIVQLQDEPFNEEIVCKVQINPDTLCQCVGPRDNNKKLVFENDLVKISGYGLTVDKETVCCIMFSKGILGWKIEYDYEDGKDYQSLIRFLYDSNDDHLDVEVIGNLFDKG